MIDQGCIISSRVDRKGTLYDVTFVSIISGIILGFYLSILEDDMSHRELNLIIQPAVLDRCLKTLHK